MESEAIIKTKINFIPIVLFLIGSVLFGYFAYVILSSHMTIAKGSDEQNGMVVKWLIFGVFIIFSVGCLYNVVRLKIFTLTKKHLIINQPLIFFKKFIPLENIEKVYEKNIQINNMSRGMQNVAVYKGKESLIELKNGKKIKFDSLTIRNYFEFKKSIFQLSKS
ncbi:MAG: hypothetical protein ABIQ27_07575 [Flavobacterium sp.]|uniref:hypothetical protein n=1 Tax=Flavobacterium sp. TaxID=239 RepID=UPI003266F937